MIQSTSVVYPSDHHHDYNKPIARLANPEKGLFFLLWQCSCMRERASDLLTQAQILTVKEQYRARVSDSAHLHGELESEERV